MNMENPAPCQETSFESRFNRQTAKPYTPTILVLFLRAAGFLALLQAMAHFLLNAIVAEKPVSIDWSSLLTGFGLFTIASLLLLFRSLIEAIRENGAHRRNH